MFYLDSLCSLFSLSPPPPNKPWKVPSFNFNSQKGLQCSQLLTYYVPSSFSLPIGTLQPQASSFSAFRSMTPRTVWMPQLELPFLFPCLRVFDNPPLSQNNFRRFHSKHAISRTVRFCALFFFCCSPVFNILRKAWSQIPLVSNGAFIVDFQILLSFRMIGVDLRLYKEISFPRSSQPLEQTAGVLCSRRLRKEKQLLTHNGSPPFHLRAVFVRNRIRSRRAALFFLLFNIVPVRRSHNFRLVMSFSLASHTF